MQDTDTGEMHLDLERYASANFGLGMALHDGLITKPKWGAEITLATSPERLTETLNNVASPDPSLSELAQKHLRLLAQACAVRRGMRGDETYKHSGEGPDISNLSDLLNVRNENGHLQNSPDDLVLLHFIDNPEVIPDELKRKRILKALADLIEADMTHLKYPSARKGAEEPKDVSLFLTRINSAIDAAKEITGRK